MRRLEGEMRGLMTETAGARYALAGHFLRGFAEILEVGGATEPLHRYVFPRPQRIQVVDPRLQDRQEEKEGCQVRWIGAGLEDARFEPTVPDFALVVVGASLCIDGQTRPANTPGWKKLARLARSAQRVVVDYAMDWVPGRRSAAFLQFVSDKPVSASLALDLGPVAPPVGAPTGSTGYARRRLVVLGENPNGWPPSTHRTHPSGESFRPERPSAEVPL